MWSGTANDPNLNDDASQTTPTLMTVMMQGQHLCFFVAGAIRALRSRLRSNLDVGHVLDQLNGPLQRADVAFGQNEFRIIGIVLGGFDHFLQIGDRVRGPSNDDGPFAVFEDSEGSVVIARSSNPVADLEKVIKATENNPDDPKFVLTEGNIGTLERAIQLIEDVADIQV